MYKCLLIRELREPISPSYIKRQYFYYELSLPFSPIGLDYIVISKSKRLIFDIVWYTWDNERQLFVLCVPVDDILSAKSISIQDWMEKIQEYKTNGWNTLDENELNYDDITGMNGPELLNIREPLQPIPKEDKKDFVFEL